MPSKVLAKSAEMCIVGYRRYLSPHKGYQCAYRAATGRSSCSQYAQQALNKHGIFTSVRLLRRRFQRCALAAVAFADGVGKEADGNFFGRCDPAVREFKKLYCRDCLGGFIESIGD